MSQTVTHAIVDIETSGLKHDRHAVLELGILLLDRDMNEVAEFSSIIADHLAVANLDWLAQAELSSRAYQRGTPEWDAFKDAVLVHEMHQKSGLADEIRAAYAAGQGWSLEQVAAAAIEFLQQHNIGSHHPVAMTGSSVHFDRGFIEAKAPELNNMFHYRNVDTSTIKTILDIYRSDITAARDAEFRPVKAHRSLPDCRDTANEYRFYLRNVFSIAAVPFLQAVQ